jgi:hypothetical protein
MPPLLDWRDYLPSNKGEPVCDSSIETGGNICLPRPIHPTIPEHQRDRGWIPWTYNLRCALIVLYPDEPTLKWRNKVAPGVKVPPGPRHRPRQPDRRSQQQKANSSQPELQTPTIDIEPVEDGESL